MTGWYFYRGKSTATTFLRLSIGITFFWWKSEWNIAIAVDYALGTPLNGNTHLCSFFPSISTLFDTESLRNVINAVHTIKTMHLRFLLFVRLKYEGNGERIINNWTKSHFVIVMTWNLVYYDFFSKPIAWDRFSLKLLVGQFTFHASHLLFDL